jgi:hypothetical protein
MERINQLLQSLSKGHGILPVLCVFILALAGMGQTDEEADFLGDNLPFTLVGSHGRFLKQS